jgi:hypothetical protein
METTESIVVLDEGREETAIVGPDAACCLYSLALFRF